MAMFRFSVVAAMLFFSSVLSIPPEIRNRFFFFLPTSYVESTARMSVETRAAKLPEKGRVNLIITGVKGHRLSELNLLTSSLTASVGE